MKKTSTKNQPFPEPKVRTGVQPDDPLSEAGRKVLLYHFAEMLRHEDGTRLGEDIEELHDMRVATRRMRAAFEVFESAFDAKAIKPHLRGLRATGRALGRVRDLDVFLEKAHHYLGTQENPGDLSPLLNEWQRLRETARARMLQYLDSAEYEQFKRKFNRFLNTKGAGAVQLLGDSPEPFLVREVAPILIYRRLGAVRAYDSVLDNASIEQLHALRIEFKKLRYTVEFFREVLGEGVKPVIEDLKKMQDHLGDLNDAEVAIEILREFLELWRVQQENLPVREQRDIEPVIAYLAARHAEHHRLLISFPQAWTDFNRPEFRRNLATAVAAL